MSATELSLWILNSLPNTPKPASPVAPGYNDIFFPNTAGKLKGLVGFVSAIPTLPLSEIVILSIKDAGLAFAFVYKPNRAFIVPVPIVFTVFINSGTSNNEPDDRKEKNKTDK